jgi:hypothetical protein
MNKRDDGRNSCGDHGAETAQKHAKSAARNST